MNSKFITSIIILLLLSSVAIAWTYTTPPNAILDTLGFRFGNSSINSTDVVSDNVIAKNIGGVIYSNQYPTIQDAINATDSNSDGIAESELYIPSGTFNIPMQPQPPNGGGILINNVGLILLNNQTITCSGKSTILTNTSIVSGINNFFVMFTNKDYINGTKNINIKNCNIKLMPPSENPTGMDAWNEGAYFEGVSNALIDSIIVTNGGFDFHPKSGANNKPYVLLNGSNNNNKVINSEFYNVTGSNSFFQGTNNIWDNSNIYGAWDDPILIGGAGQGNKILNSYINGTSPVLNKGGATAGIYFGNDGSVGGSDVMSNNVVQGNDINGMRLYVGGSGISIVGAATNNKIISNNIYNNNVSGIHLESNVTNSIITGNNIYNNSQYGIRSYVNLGDSQTGIISDNNIYDNPYGLHQYVYGTTGYQIHNNRLYNNSVADVYFTTETVAANRWQNEVLSNKANIYTFFNVAQINLNGTIINNKGLSPFNFGNSASPPSPFGAGDTYYNTTSNKPCYRNTTMWLTYADSSVGCQ